MARKQADKAVDAGKKKAKKKMIKMIKKMFKKHGTKTFKKLFSSVTKKNPYMLAWLGGKLTVHHGCMYASSSYKSHMMRTKWNPECEPTQNCALLIDYEYCVLWFPQQIVEEAAKVSRDSGRRYRLA